MTTTKPSKGGGLGGENDDDLVDLLVWFRISRKPFNVQVRSACVSVRNSELEAQGRRHILERADPMLLLEYQY